MGELNSIWEKTCKVFPILQNSKEDPSTSKDDLRYVATKLSELELLDVVYETIWIRIESHLQHKTVPKFWNSLIDDCAAEVKFYQFQLAVCELERDYSTFQDILEQMSLVFRRMSELPKVENRNKNDKAEFNHLLKSILLAKLPANFNDIVYLFYSLSFKVFANSQQDDEQDDIDIDDIKCIGCEKEPESCNCQELVCAFNKTNEYLVNMDLLDRIAGYTLTSLIRERINSYVQDTCKGIFDSSHIAKLEKWLDTVVLNWLTRIHNRGTRKIDENDSKTRDVVNGFKLKLSYYLHETYANMIIDQFFNIIIDYPDSQPAIDDLKVCLEKLDLRSHLVKTLKKSLETRLLHPGVNTMDILTGYVAAIKAIRHLDSSGVLLETVTEPVKEYLRKRSDTVRRVVTGLTEEGPTDLAEELARTEKLKENIDVNAKDEMANWESWQPDPIDANPSKNTRSNRTADIISMVVDIYGSKELFVNEYRNLLADRLLTNLDFNPEKEIRNLELLKLRFGETLLHSCEVMLKDISDSKRINSHIQSDINYSNSKQFDISSLILSSQFWPALNKETLELPEEFQEEFKKYTSSYETYKGNRTLCWRPVTGRVLIEIHLTNKIIEMAVTPTQAAIIYHFQEKNEWTLENLSSVIKVPASILRKRIVFWQTQGLIKEKSNDVFVLIDEDQPPDSMDLQTAEVCEEDDSESAMASASDQREEELQVFWSYIVGMLTNLDSLPIERIHQMLKMFASHGPGVEFSQEELKNFLQRKVREHKLTFISGVYHLPK